MKQQEEVQKESSEVESQESKPMDEWESLLDNVLREMDQTPQDYLAGQRQMAQGE